MYHTDHHQHRRTRRNGAALGISRTFLWQLWRIAADRTDPALTVHRLQCDHAVHGPLLPNRTSDADRFLMTPDGAPCGTREQSVDIRQPARESPCHEFEMSSHAANIDVYALGGSIPIASYLRHQFIKLGIRTNICSDSYTMRMSQAQLKQDDVVIAISCSGKTAEIIEAMTSAKALGASTICVTTVANSPLAQLTDIALITANERFITLEDSIYGRMSNLVAVDILYAGLASKKR